MNQLTINQCVRYLNKFYFTSSYRKKEIVFMTFQTTSEWSSLERFHQRNVEFVLDFVNFLYVHNEKRFPNHRGSPRWLVTSQTSRWTQINDIISLLHEWNESLAVNLLSANSLVREFAMYRSKLAKRVCGQ
jgi:hypothetical protein